MLWIGTGEMVCVGMLSGIIGAVVMAIAIRQNNKFNMEMMEEHWKEDIWQLQGSMRLAHHKIEDLTGKISTLSVDKPVSNGKNYHHNKGCKTPRHFNQRG